MMGSKRTRHWINRNSARLALAVGLCAGASALQADDYRTNPGPPPVPANVQAKAAVKQYVVDVAHRAEIASQHFEADATAYAAVVARHGNNVSTAAAAEPQTVERLLINMRDDYKGIHNYGYEYIEGIVGGVPQLIKYDIELDGGVPVKGAGVQDQVAPVTLQAGDETIDREGSLNSYLIEAAVYGTNPRWVAGKATLPQLGPVNLPKPVLVVAFGNYAVDGYHRLETAAQQWQPTDRDFFQAMFTMTPTLSDYFDDWKETKKYGSASGGRFIGVSRVSDMRGILGSTQLTWECMADKVSGKDPALAAKITQGYDQIMAFINKIYGREQTHPLKVETIDALGSQAKEKAERLTVQVAQAAAVLGIDVNNK
jgi:hypothetical protein